MPLPRPFQTSCHTILLGSRQLGAFERRRPFLLGVVVRDLTQRHIRNALDKWHISKNDGDIGLLSDFLRVPSPPRRCRQSPIRRAR